METLETRILTAALDGDRELVRQRLKALLSHERRNLLRAGNLIDRLLVEVEDEESQEAEAE